jgi:transposase
MRLLRLRAVNVTALEWSGDTVTVTLRRRRLVCPHCRSVASDGHDVRPGMSRRRPLDLGVWRVEIQARFRRLRCPTHGVVVEGVPSPGRERI